jgi:hypothetical protein
VLNEPKSRARVGLEAAFLVAVVYIVPIGAVAGWFDRPAQWLSDNLLFWLQ